MRSFKGSLNSYARRQAKREISKYVHARNKNNYIKLNIEEDKFAGSGVWEYIKWIFEPEKL